MPALKEQAKPYYLSQVAELESEKNKIRSKLNSVLIWRLVSFVLSVSLPILCWSFSHSLSIFLGGIFLIAFGLLVKLNLKWVDLHKRNKTGLHLVLEELNALNGKPTEFDHGSEYINADHHYSHDLDIFGANSLFQYLNRCSTITGHQLLGESLESETFSFSKIERIQQSVDELSKLHALRRDIQITGVLSGETEKSLKHFLDWSRSPMSIRGRGIWNVLVIVVPLYSALLTGLYAFDYLSGLQFLMLLIFSLLPLGFKKKSIMAEYGKLGEQHAAFGAYSDIFSTLKNQDFKSPNLITIAENSGGAAGALNDLSRIVSAFDNRKNMIAGVLLNIYLLWDIVCIRRLSRWHDEYADKIESWLDNLGRFEVYSSFSTFHFNNADRVVYPKESSGELNAIQLAHPLIPVEERVANDIEMKGNQIAIITGANMAGKSTFLRTLGVNLILAMAGAPVVADRFEFKPLLLFSSMRTTDSLASNESYFFNELKRLETLVKLMEKGDPIFVILDEILKGTNSKDKAEGSFRFVEKILKFPVSGVIATHDLSLCEIEKDHQDQIVNQCFEVDLSNDQLRFDYKLRNGVCQNMNASFLLKKMGIT